MVIVKVINTDLETVLTAHCSTVKKQQENTQVVFELDSHTR